MEFHELGGQSLYWPPNANTMESYSSKVKKEEKYTNPVSAVQYVLKQWR